MHLCAHLQGNVLCGCVYNGSGGVVGGAKGFLSQLSNGLERPHTLNHVDAMSSSSHRRSKTIGSRSSHSRVQRHVTLHHTRTHTHTHTHTHGWC